MLRAVQEVPATVAYPASDEAALLTGSDLSINGGQQTH